MCQKFIGILKKHLRYMWDHIQHLDECSECIKWMKHCIRVIKGGEDK